MSNHTQAIAFLHTLDTLTSHIKGFSFEDIDKRNFLWHYTTTETHYHAFQAMRNPENHCHVLCHGWPELWATRSEFLNDRSEIEFGLIIAREMLNRSLLGERTTSYLRTLVDSAAFHECYVSCFSGTPDLLDQWRSYGDDGNGVCVGFVRQQLIENNVSGWVLYTLEQQEALLGYVFDFLGSWHIEAKPTSGHEPIYSENLIRDLLASCMLLLKNPAFQAEDEFRLIWTRPRPAYSGGAPDSIRYRIKNSRVIPFVAVRRHSLASEKLMWTTPHVWTGPGFAAHEQRAFEEYISSLSGDNCWTSHSSVPYRPSRCL